MHTPNTDIYRQGSHTVLSDTKLHAISIPRVEVSVAALLYKYYTCGTCLMIFVSNNSCDMVR